MKNLYVKLEDLLQKKQYSYDLKNYAVLVSDINRAEKIEVFDEDESETEELKQAVKALCNRCAVQTRLQLCFVCGMRDLCDKYRTAFRKEGAQQ